MLGLRQARCNTAGGYFSPFSGMTSGNSPSWSSRQVGTTTPVDPAYVTSRNMLSSKRPMHVAIWSLGKAMNMGSMLLGWAGKGAS